MSVNPTSGRAFGTLRRAERLANRDGGSMMCHSPLVAFSGTVSTSGMEQGMGIGPQSPIELLIQGPPLRVPPGCSLGFAARAMRAVNVSAALVENGDAIVTERDLTRTLASGLGPEAAVSAACVPDPFTLAASTSVVDAAAEMLRHEIRHLVVKDSGDVLGIVSLREVMAVLLQALDPAVWVATLRAALTTHTEIWLG